MKKLLSKIAALGIIATIASTSVMAQEPTISRWSALDVYETYNYGIFDMNWLGEDMRCPISSEKFEELFKLTDEKLGDINGVKKNTEISITAPEGEITKEAVLNTLYTILTSYDYTSDLAFEGKDALTYMQEIKVVQGDGKNLGLEDACTVEQAIVMAQRLIEYTYDVCDSDSKGLLWKVEKDGNTVYMLGSIHIANSNIYPMSKEVKDAYESADELVVECNTNVQPTAEMEAIKVYSDGTTVKDYLSADYYEKLTTVLKEYELTPEQIGSAKDWSIALTLELLESMNNGGSEDISMKNVDGIDMFFLVNAQMTGKNIGELESIMYQLEMLDGMSQELKTYNLETRIDSTIAGKSSTEGELSDVATGFNDMLDDWKTGDAEGLKEELVGDEEAASDLTAEELVLVEEYNKAMLTDRDKGMADKIEGYLNAEGSKTYFVVAGAAHYVTDTGIIAQLKEKGYEVTQIK